MLGHGANRRRVVHKQKSHPKCPNCGWVVYNGGKKR